MKWGTKFFLYTVMHAKYRCSKINTSEDMFKVKLFCDREMERVMDGQVKA